MNTNPFGDYGFDNSCHFKSFYQCRKAKYKETAKTDFNPNYNRDYFNTPEPPTPNLQEVDGYLSEAEVEAEESKDDTQKENNDGGQP